MEMYGTACNMRIDMPTPELCIQGECQVLPQAEVQDIPGSQGWPTERGATLVGARRRLLPIKTKTSLR